MRRARTRRGMSFLEIMAGLFVLALTMVTATALFPLSSLLRDKSGGYSRAASVVQHKLEQLRELEADQLTAANLLSLGMIDAENDTAVQTVVDEAGISRLSSLPLTFNTVDELADELENASGTVQLTDVGSDLVQAEVVLTWTGYRGTSNRIEATTYVADISAWREP
ncbi:MAG: hypothetical protein ACK47B_06990 [Armatimonadota bacterium]